LSKKKRHAKVNGLIFEKMIKLLKLKKMRKIFTGSPKILLHFKYLKLKIADGTNLIYESTIKGFKLYDSL